MTHMLLSTVHVELHSLQHVRQNDPDDTLIAALVLICNPVSWTASCAGIQLPAHLQCKTLFQALLGGHAQVSCVSRCYAGL